ncbi:MAG TPA: 16S rRNA (adenine(1518)-N(6)/adenine(1519)-N(6))-dimethyltransferase RsmA [Candidatus Portnoybacteria bacterium]|nr:16S rRNA (adenine(1518)-N(6)/adenine(1519)-N(6))-dimethyltransferase RsmA [Candidatus Portnoybacteria bacterium]MDD5752342.1 16S rRNA (adenine(1518)-N(6)/adenine(1519)-N(6))-dimethyltransferase RsmA [Candidatus Portnoybacteria bacterium]HOZ16473.1 16S rRNA (adenine(1518)-N(6)/adenine(1519)-N(6))-dimethyltransferase RsmA [Candidatus Portnoybacteria bacterium]HPH52095.1 16S rRNA (adenine(1518)-N(6)/adenine(1519)-N(6))-dimethyltransferase RsmA [Candidatus Portnoybacteria bacterium]HPJ80292.1 16
MTEFQNILKKYNIKPNKFMGQNFLIDKNILNKIIKTADIKSNDVILEIGPGPGMLTIELAKKAKKIVTIEKDKKMCVILQKILDVKNIKNVEIINTDILKIFNSQFSIFNKFSITNYKIVANIPYYLTSPLIRKFLETDNPPSEIILMIQKEVAERICAKPPKMSLLSVAVQFYAKPEIIALVSKNCFYPAPKIDSAIIKIIPQANTNYDKSDRKIDTEKFFRLVKTGFSAKRKMLFNNLKSEFQSSNVKSILKNIGLNPNCRAENLSIDDWIKLYTLLFYVDK